MSYYDRYHHRIRTEDEALDPVRDHLHNHFAIVADASYSMKDLEQKVVQVIDGEIAHLAEQARANPDQLETRISVYHFSNDVRCAIWDRDVLRVPSIRQHYRVDGDTALLDATAIAIRDLQKIPRIHGSHAFFLLVFTDGQENQSQHYRAEDIRRLLGQLADDRFWTVSILVPDRQGERYAQSLGFPAGNINIWDPNSKQGIEQVQRDLRTATQTFTEARLRGETRVSGGVFRPNTANLTAANVAQNLEPLLEGKDYVVLTPRTSTDVRSFVEAATGKRWRKGQPHYLLSKREDVQSYKTVLVRNRRTGRVYGGPNTRSLLGLPAHDTPVAPDDHPEYDVFIASTAPNRRLVANHDLILHPAP